MPVFAAVDLHVHTALSPCAANDMRPPAILLTAERRGIAVIGVADHGSAGNARAVFAAAPAFSVRVFAGLEVESAEGIHVVTLFDDPEAVDDMDRVVRAHLPVRENRPDLFGDQLLVNEWGDEIGRESRLLMTAANLSIEAIAALAHERNGMVIPAHIDRKAGGLLPVLGLVPPGLDVDAYEISRHMTIAGARERWPQLADLPLMTASDAHDLGAVGSAVTWIPQELAEAPLDARNWGRDLAAVLTESR